MALSKEKILFVLIGANPLPNFVVSHYFIEQEHIKSLGFIYSEKTKYYDGTLKIAENIEHVLKSKFGDIAIQKYALQDISDSHKIRKDLDSQLKGFDYKSTKILLNYTGGTKLMTVQSYNYFKSKTSQISFSYLNSYDFSIKFDEVKPPSHDLRNPISITLDDLLALHGCKRVREDEIPEGMKDILAEFETLINNKKTKLYIKWKDKTLRKIYYDEEDKFIVSVKKFRDHVKYLCKKFSDEEESNKKNNPLHLFLKEPFSKTALSILRKLPSNYTILDNNDFIWIPDKNITKSDFKKRIGTAICNYLDGKWLEHYITTIITDKVNSVDDFWSQLYFSSNIHLQYENAKKNFEIDCLILYSYQLIGISITTSLKGKECKLKAFEVLHRVSQIGGDESKAILVTCLSMIEISDLKTDLLSDMDISKKLLIIGEDNLNREDFFRELREFIG